jgi:DNA-binding transcriptional regulator YiaG
MRMQAQADKKETMVTVSIKDEYAEILTTLGDLHMAIDRAVQRYTLDQITAKIAELRQKDASYRTKYGMDYPAFAHRIATDESFVQDIEARENKMWERDLAEWEFCYKGIEDWMHKLQSVLLK